MNSEWNETAQNAEEIGSDSLENRVLLDESCVAEGEGESELDNDLSEREEDLIWNRKREGIAWRRWGLGSEIEFELGREDLLDCEEGQDEFLALLQELKKKRAEAKKGSKETQINRGQHICKKCEKKFTRSFDMYSHRRRIHNESFPERDIYWCVRCEKGYMRGGNFKRHMKAAHDFPVSF